jgi:hypothetical protein
VQITDVCVGGPNPMGQTCIAGVNNQPSGAPEVLTFLNGSMAPRTVFLVVDTADMAPTSFDLNIEFLISPAGDVCSTAVPASGPLLGQDLSPFTDDYNGGPGCAPGTGPDRVYSVTIPAGNRLSATVTAQLPDGGVGFVPSLNLITSPTCAVTSACTAASQTPGASSTTLLYDNVGTAPQSAFLVVDTASAIPQSTFDLGLTIAPTMLQQGDVCANTAMPITTSTMLTMQPFAGYVNHYGIGVEGTTCFFDDGPDRVYAVTVPAGFRLRAIGNANYSYNLDLVAGPASNCQTNPVTCLDRQSTPMGGSLTARYDNFTGMSQTVFVIVDRQVAAPMTDVFDLGIDLQLIPAYDTCGTAGMPITMNTTLMMQNLANAADDYAWSGQRCVSSAFGSPDFAYAVSVPAGQRLTATATSMTFNPVLNVVGTPTCAPVSQACVAGSNASLGLTETVTWDNNDATARTVFVVVEAGTGAAPGVFDLAISFAPAPPPPYTRTTIMAACQPLTGAASALPSALGDDVFAAWTPMPFSFSFFGTTVANFSVASNGYVGFSNLTVGNVGPTGAGSYNNVGIPTATTPNGIAAPFWDDLVSVMGSQVRHETFGMMGSRRWVLEWTDFAPFPSASPERLTFQVHVLEGTNVIEYHYCSLNPNAGDAARASGGSATVGLEDSTGAIGVEHSLNAPMSVTTGTGLRFTP